MIQGKERKSVGIGIVWAIVMLLMAITANAATPEEALQRFLNRSGVPRQSVAVKLTDLSDGHVLASHNSSTPLIPASIMKSVTVATLLEKTSPEWRWHTRIYTDGDVSDGVLHGNIIVEGALDPSVNSEVEPFGTDILQEIAGVLDAMGVKTVAGDIIVEDGGISGAPRPSSWQSADFVHSYGTGSHPFNFSNNCNGRRSVENPASVFKARLRSALLKSGITVSGIKITGNDRNMIFDHVSPPLDEVMRSCMMRSDNLFAESMLRTFGHISGGDGSTPDAARRELQSWRKRGVPLEGVHIVDGSGLSRENRVTADFMTAVLAENSGDVQYASFFPLAGQDGTLKSFLAETPLEGYMAMKTGSMNGIQCYAGYLLDENYTPTHTAVIIMNDFRDRSKARKAAQEMLLEIFAAERVGEQNNP